MDASTAGLSEVVIGQEILPAEFLEAITVKEKPEPHKAKSSILKSPTAKEKEKKKASRKQARQSRKENR